MDENMKNKRYKMYLLHDPIGNYEGQITDFNKESLQEAINQGLTIIGITQNDSREIIKDVNDVVEPQMAIVNGLTVVLPSYVDSKVDNLANIVEQLLDIIVNPLSSPSILKNIKESIQKIHNDTLKVIEEDRKMIESSSSIKKRETENS